MVALHMLNTPINWIRVTWNGRPLEKSLPQIYTQYHLRMVKLLSSTLISHDVYSWFIKCVFIILKQLYDWNSCLGMDFVLVYKWHYLIWILFPVAQDPIFTKTTTKFSDKSIKSTGGIWELKKLQNSNSL